MVEIQKLKVIVRNRQGIMVEEEVAAVSAFNKVGPFDVLPQHANFVSMINKKVILHKLDKKKQEIPVDNGVMLVEENKVKVFIGVSKV
jgi:F0F1-type ATP synthase epsilon subunit